MLPTPPRPEEKAPSPWGPGVPTRTISPSTYLGQVSVWQFHSASCDYSLNKTALAQVEMLNDVVKSRKVCLRSVIRSNITGSCGMLDRS